MAKIINFEKGNGRIKGNITEVVCVYTTDLINGEKYIALSTLGSSNRKDEGKASQVLHINKECAKKLVDILISEFNL